MPYSVVTAQQACSTEMVNVEMYLDIDNVYAHDMWPLTTVVTQGRCQVHPVVALFDCDKGSLNIR